MVPGMTERERLAAEQRRLEWLAAARFGPARLRPAPARCASEPARRHALIGSLKNGISAAVLSVVRRVRPAQLETANRASRTAAAAFHQAERSVAESSFGL